MGKQTEQQFYDRLNELDDDDSGWLLAHCICALIGSVAGFLIGSFLGSM